MEINRTALLWAIMRRVVVISYRRLGQPTGPIFKRLFGLMSLEDGTDRLSRYIRTKL